MNDDPWSEAARALRETGEAGEFEARSTRARVLAGLQQTRVRHRTRIVFLLPIAATFVAVSAWGAGSGNAQHAFEAVQRWFSPAPPAAHANVKALKSAHAIPPPPVPVPVLVPMPLPVLPLESTPNLAASSSPGPTPQPPLSRPRISAHAEPIDPALTLYRAAHTAHFVDHDAERALAGWDAYLAAAPGGQFAPEARYNRALSLVRLGRSAEARAALGPFANGAFGNYRKDEANALLERLGE